MSNGTNTASESSPRASQTDISPSLPSSLTCVSSYSPVQPNNIKALRTWLQQAFLVSHSAQQVQSVERMTAPICGQRRGTLFGLFDRQTSSWKTSQGCLEGMQQPLPLTWPKWATWDQVACYQLPDKEPTISARGSGFVVTPTRTANQLAPSMMKHPGCRRMYPTPNAGGSHWGGTWQELGGAGNWLRDTTEASAKIHPEEWEWMMGWPIGWTDLQPLEMDKFQQWLHAHGGIWHDHP